MDEIMNNEVIMDEATEVAVGNPGKGLKDLAIVLAVTAGVGVVAAATYKLGKRVIAKINAAKMEKAIKTVEIEVEPENDDSEEI